MADVIDRELAWDDEIEKDGDFVIIPEGDYPFTVAGFDRGRHDGSEKLPPCPKAIITLRIELPDGTTQNMTHNLFLHSKCEGLLSAFFVGIGQKKHGEKLRMNWSNIIGARGKCKITIRTWKNKNGEDMQSNEVKKFYEPDNTPVTQPAPQQMYGTPTGYPQQPAPQYTPAPQPVAQAAPVAQGVYTPGQW